MIRNVKTVEAKDLETNQKLTKWKNEPSVTDLKEDLNMAKPSHDEHAAKVQEWLELRNPPRKKQPASREGKRIRSTIQPKLIRRQAEWRYSALSEPFLSADKTFKVDPVTFEDANGARQNELVLNWQFRTKMNPVKFIDDFVRAVVDEGTCVVKVGWKRRTVLQLVPAPIWQYMVETDPNKIEMLNQALDLMDTNPAGFNTLPADVQESAKYSSEKGVYATAIQIGETQIEEEKVLENRPTLDILHYENLYLDPSCGGDITKANFAIISFETSKAELLKDGRYTNLDKVNWSSNEPLHHPTHHSDTDTSRQFNDELRKRVVAYEYWGFYDVDGSDELTPIVATWIGETMIRMEENPFPDQQLPLVVVPYLPVKDSLTGEPDAELLGDNQDVIGAVMRGIIDLMARAASGQRAIAKGALDAVNKRKFIMGEDYEYNPGADPRGSIYDHSFSEIPASALQVLGMQNQEAEALTGVKAFAGGMSGESYGEVAAGIRGMLDAASKREMSILRRLAQGMSEIGRKIVAMNGAFLSEEEVVAVTNETFVTVRREDLIGEFNTKVDIATAEVDEAKAQDLGFMLQTLGNTIPWEITQGLLSELARLKRLPALAHQIKQFKPEPDPLQQKLKELEIAKLEAEIADIKTKAMLNQAKAREVLSGADLKDQAFVDNQTGTTHAREMEKQQAQAEANQLLEVTKRVLEPDEKTSKRTQISDGLLLTALAKNEA